MLHGEADTVTDPEVSRALYEQASSIDKTIKMYPGMWHGLTSGEPDDNIEIVFSDILSWLDKRSGGGESSKQPNTGPENLATVASSMAENGQNPYRAQQNAKNLCGWKGRGLYHHSAM